MYWLRRPPYLRWIAIGLLLSTTLYLDLRGPATTTSRFATRAVATGEMIDETNTALRTVPAGLLPVTPESLGQRAAHPMDAGDPIVRSSLSTDSPAPDDWWAISLPVPAATSAGSSVRVLIVTTGRIADGTVVDPPIDDGFRWIALTAFSEGDAAAVAAAVATDEAVVMIGTDR